MNIIDISLSLHEKTIVYPGNPEIEIEEQKTKTSFISKITFGSHSGTHVDAPRHAHEDGLGIDEIPPETFIGPCRVLDMTHAKEKVRREDLEKEDIKEGERILVKTTNSERGFETLYEDYVYLDGDGAAYLGERGIILFGIDYLSVKQRGSADNRPHTELLDKGIVIFEGVDLSKAEPGEYEFIGLPLKFRGLDGAPARAVLQKR